MRTLAATILLLVCSVANAAVHRVEVPAHVCWCKTVTIVEKDVQTPNGTDAILRKTTSTIEECARAAKLIYIGIPYVASTVMSDADDGSRKADATLCVVVSTDVEPPCAGASVTKVPKPPQQVVAVVCAEDKVDQCRKEISNALLAEPFNADKETVEKLAWRFVQPQVVTNDDLATIVAALTDATGNRVDHSGKDVQMRVAPKAIVIAAPIPPAKPAPVPVPDAQ